MFDRLITFSVSYVMDGDTENTKENTRRLFDRFIKDLTEKGVSLFTVTGRDTPSMPPKKPTVIAFSTSLFN